MRMRYKAVLLDLDGTLLDTLGDIAAAANAMLEDMGHPPLAHTLLATFVGKGSRNMVERTLTAAGGARTPPAEADITRGHELYQAHYRRINGHQAQAYPGVMTGLSAFRQARLKMAVVTNKPTEFTHDLLVRKGMAHFFDAVVCGDTCEQRKPDPMPVLHACQQLAVAPEGTLFIGDSINDALAARAAGTDVVIVPYGYNEGRDVHDLDVDAIVASIEDAASWAAQVQPDIQTS